MNSLVIGIDIGGTAIKMGCFSRDGICHKSLTLPTPQPATPKAVIEVIEETISILRKESQTDNLGTIQGIGIGVPGPVDAEGRISRIAINLSDWQEVPLAESLEEKTGLPVVIANDANCAGLGEAWVGAGSQFKNMIMLTLGTGVGGAIILDSKLFVGHQGTAGELGLITLNPDGPKCNSGNNGSLEQYVSVQAVRRETGKEPLELANLALAGDKFALEFWQNYGRLLGAGLASLIYILTPEAVIIGGGISAASELFLPTTKAEIERRVLFSSRSSLQLLTAKLGNQAGIVGAAKLAWTKFSDR
ncbi:MAG: ROK family protein [Okeania sp. SIO3I5]|uniref:ROK family protein n=1 Tax=Okeania sp. SIO3I5 TaxID=2607805 RepID=UPI0013B62071|nr:ROK family protein [Okeania sp. SIO3I5]NEQ36437.1 ROK family protein [Okeania sp. SIO3I5]